MEKVHNSGRALFLHVGDPWLLPCLFKVNIVRWQMLKKIPFKYPQKLDRVDTSSDRENSIFKSKDTVEGIFIDVQSRARLTFPASH